MAYEPKRRVHLALLLTTVVVLAAFLFLRAPRLKGQTQQQPNILVIMGDDIGWYNPSIYNRGDMGYSDAEH